MLESEPGKHSHNNAAAVASWADRACRIWNAYPCDDALKSVGFPVNDFWAERGVSSSQQPQAVRVLFRALERVVRGLEGAADGPMRLFGPSDPHEQLLNILLHFSAEDPPPPRLAGVDAVPLAARVLSLLRDDARCGDVPHDGVVRRDHFQARGGGCRHQRGYGRNDHPHGGCFVPLSSAARPHLRL